MRIAAIGTSYIWLWLLSSFGPKVERHLSVRSDIGIDV